jgi:nucleoside-diphosphate-sugar epimerase
VRILVTGATGYVGGAVVDGLVRAGHEPIAFARSAGPSDVEQRLGDLLDADSIRRSLGGVEAVCHLAGATQARTSWSKPVEYFQVNAVGTNNLLHAMVDEDVTRLVFASTGAIYGSPADQPMSEALPDAIPHPYAASKRAAELAVEWTARSGRIAATTLRLFNVAGGWDPDQTRLIPKVLAVAAGDAPHLDVNGDGSAVRDLLHVKDAADAFACALAQQPPAGENRRYNIGSGIGFSVAQVIAVAERVTSCHIRVVHRPPANEPARLIADPRLAKSALGWTPRRSSLENIVADAWTTRRNR